jgi:hypothetical protein
LARYSVLLLLFAVLLPSGFAFDKDKKRGEPDVAVALIAGTVYRPPGLALPGAKITVLPESSSRDVKSKKLSAFSDSRGEFAVRVPAVPGTYRVNVKREGFHTQERSVDVAGEQRYEVSIVLDPVASK